MSKDKKPKLFLGNNITAKTKNATFWVGLIPAVATFLVSLCSLLGIANAEEVINQGASTAGLLVGVLTSLGVLVSHDTKGISDSEIVKTDFTKPRDSKDPEQSLAWENSKADSIIDEGSHPMAPDVVGELEHEDILAVAEPMERLDSETPVDGVPDEHKTSSPKG